MSSIPFSHYLCQSLKRYGVFFAGKQIECCLSLFYKWAAFCLRKKRSPAPIFFPFLHHRRQVFPLPLQNCRIPENKRKKGYPPPPVPLLTPRTSVAVLKVYIRVHFLTMTSVAVYRLMRVAEVIPWTHYRCPTINILDDISSPIYIFLMGKTIISNDNRFE